MRFNLQPLFGGTPLHGPCGHFLRTHKDCPWGAGQKLSPLPLPHLMGCLLQADTGVLVHDTYEVPKKVRFFDQTINQKRTVSISNCVNTFSHHLFSWLGTL